ncbi:hypothetical protein C8Q77DRAFT_1099826 [Trametes polyzona]|nr:hypothetical protein C8Q77DRAFT_1099826 [Trametes polyzona]
MKDIRAFMEGRAKELYEFLEGLVKEGVVPPADRKNNKGGIVVAGWSLGTGWMTALLAHAPSFPVGDVNLADYMQRVVFFDPPFQVMGYPTTEKGLYNPLFEKDIPPEERESVFAKWVSGYFEHGDTPETLALKTPLREPTPTLTRLTPADIARTLYLPAAGAEAPDSALLYRGIELGSWVSLREAALAERAGNGWDAVEVRNVTCERSPCDCLWAMMCLRREVDEARAKGLPVRDVHFVLIKGANHFVQWDQPEHLLRALVGNEDIVQ